MIKDFFMKKNLATLFRKYFLVASINMLVLIALLEVTLRLIPSKYTEYPARINYNSDKELGYFPEPLQDESYIINCVANSHIKTNEIGMRITPSFPNSPIKISLLGDSFLHGLTVSDSLHMATKLSLLSKMEVMNGGVCGYGTYQELLLWRKYMKPKKPNITILFFFMDNDIRDNQCSLERGEGEFYSPCCIVDSNKVKEVNDFEIRKNESKSFTGWFKKNSFTYRALRNLWKSDKLKQTGEEFFNQTSFAYNLYRPGYNKIWDDGWKITEWSLAALKKECDEVGSKLLIVKVPGPIQWTYNWKKEIAKQIQDDYLPLDFNIDYPDSRFQSIINQTGIDMLDLNPSFIKYRDQFKLQEPVFGWCCDAHWNPLGHELAANLVYNHLLNIGWLSGQIIENTKSPKEVLGEKMFEDIYSCQQIKF